MAVEAVPTTKTDKPRSIRKSRKTRWLRGQEYRRAEFVYVPELLVLLARTAEAGELGAARLVIATQITDNRRTLLASAGLLALLARPLGRRSCLGRLLQTETHNFFDRARFLRLLFFALEHRQEAQFQMF